MSSVALLLILAGVNVGAIGAEPQVDARRDGEAVVLEASAPLHATIGQAWRVLTDYERYPAFVPDLALSRVVSRDGAKVVLEQEGEVGFLFFHQPVRVRLEVTEQPAERVTARAVQGNFRQMDGEYELRSEGGTVQLYYRGRLVPDFALPPLIGLAAVRRATQRQFSALVHEIDRQGSAAPAPR